MLNEGVFVASVRLRLHHGRGPQARLSGLALDINIDTLTQAELMGTRVD